MTIPQVDPIYDATLAATLEHAINTKTKPPGSLGMLEALAKQLGLIQRSAKPGVSRPAILVFAGDHGVVAENISPYPQSVTWQMVENFLAGGAAINVFARANGCDIHVVDAGYKLLGTLPLDKFLRTPRKVKIEEIMNAEVIEIEASEDQEEAARKFERYDLVEVAVIDESGRLVGVLTIDDMVDVIHEEATEDMQLLAGVGDEDLSDGVRDAVRSRSTWLVVSLLTASLSSLVIGLFDATIEQMVALAVLMPMVASMGGNAGTQTMTVTVRALAMRELDSFKLRRLVSREVLVGFCNGGIFAVLIGVVTWLRFANPELGLVIALAMVVNMVAAGSAGVLIPLTLDRFKIDPAVASATFVTMITDVVGFFSFLGLAGLWFHLF